MAMLLHDKLKLQLAEIIEESIKKAYPDIDHKPNINELYNSLSSTPNPKMGQIAFACFPLAKAFRGNPAQIATSLLENLGKNPLIDKAITAGPYLNFFINT